ncbi:RNA endoribonuclease [Desmophyllum pertusum]|uniref:RNA endoribonuclease n=1 Tax=Desmophyllum pertusum TaxID=174260 RepID=A0A9W9ZAL3_9CNID|nr:RNA endoribonuclease [Desmophyllum pertusum]
MHGLILLIRRTHPVNKEAASVHVHLAVHAGSDELNQGVGTFLPTKNLYSRPPHEQNTTGYTSTQPLNRRKVNSDKLQEHEKAQLSDNNDIAMEIDNYEELEDQIKLELQGMRSEFVLDPLQVSGESESMQQFHIRYAELYDTLYVVLDTNVLLSHLKLISELKDFPIEGVARPVLIIPWIVIQELDSLKSDSWRIKKGKLVSSSKNKNGKFGVDTLARQAVRFLHLCFEAREMMENCSIEDPNNDDKILQCCLLFQRKADNGHAILFSNDQNLCSKAIINGVKAFNHQSLVMGLKELFQNTAVVLKQDHFQDYYKELKLQESLAQRRAKADDLTCELQCIMREGLAVVVETEMRAAYEDLWDKIVFIKPPWTLADLLQLLNKHWIAVFGHVFKRSIKTTVEDLQKHFSGGGGGGSPGCLANALIILDQARTLFEVIAARSSYNGSITKCVTAIIVLVRKCKEYQNDIDTVQPARSQAAMVMGPPLPQVPALRAPLTGNSESRSSSNETEQENSSGKFEEGSEESGSVHEINTAQADNNPHALVLSTFETIWNAVNQFSAQIFNGVGFPHPVPLGFLEDLAKPTRDEAIQFLSRLCSCLAFVVTAIQSVLQEPKGSEAGSIQLFETLLQAITQFFQQILSMNTHVTVSELFRFARDPNARMGLIQGCSQLDRALATLQQCSNWVVSSEQ